MRKMIPRQSYQSDGEKISDVSRLGFAELIRRVKFKRQPLLHEVYLACLLQKVFIPLRTE